MNLVTKHEFSSRDVLFHESIFPFHPQSASRYMHHVPPSMPTHIAAYSDELHTDEQLGSATTDIPVLHSTPASHVPDSTEITVLDCIH